MGVIFCAILISAFRRQGACTRTPLGTPRAFAFGTIRYILRRREVHIHVHFSATTRGVLAARPNNILERVIKLMTAQV